MPKNIELHTSLPRYDLHPTDPKHACKTSWQRLSEAFLAVVALCYMISLLSRIVQGRAQSHHSATGGISSTGLDVPEHIQRLWGQYSPWFPAGEYVSPPSGCNITQINLLQRHGARYPTSSDAPSYREAVRKLTSAERYSDDNLKFLDGYEYVLGENDLTPFGAFQSWHSGWEMHQRYGNLLWDDEDIYIRVPDSQRVVDSAGNWSQGLAEASGLRLEPRIGHILSESVNNTLQNDCPNSSQGVPEKDTWLHQYAPPITARLNQGARGANLTDQDVFAAMAMCPFESIALASGDLQKARSKFCNLFSEDEWRAFDYHGDVEKYYKTGYGNPLGPVQGVGYTNELIARLTNQPVYDNTTHNASMPFPLGRMLYADFSHENTLVAIYSSIGLLRLPEREVPDPRHMPKDGEGSMRLWKASRMVPFSGRMVTERLECVVDKQEEQETETFVRIFVNEVLQQLEFCGGKLGVGMCRLDAFVASQRYAKRNGDGDFERCYN